MQQKLAIRLEPANRNEFKFGLTLLICNKVASRREETNYRVPHLLPANTGSAGVPANLPHDQTIEQPLGQTGGPNFGGYYLVCSLRV